MFRTLVGLFQPANAAGIFVHIAVIYIAARVDKQVQRNKNNNSISNMNRSSLADAKTKNRQQEKRERYPQVQYSIMVEDGRYTYLFCLLYVTHKARFLVLLSNSENTKKENSFDPFGVV